MKLFDILDFTTADTIDILLFTAFLYYIYRLIRGTAAINIFMGIVTIYLLWKITEALQMQLPNSILRQFIGVGVFMLIVAFRQETRRFLLIIGSTNITVHNKLHCISHFLKQKESLLNVEDLVSICYKFGTTHTGALIVIERSTPLDFVIATGDKMNLELSEPIIESISYKNSPLHDGAIVIRGNTIVATRVTLPVVAEDTLPKHYGLRHRAAVSTTEKADATALVVSEETGHIPYFKDGNFVKSTNEEELIKMIQEDN